MATVTRIAASTSLQVAAAVNSARKGLIVENSDANRCYILAGPGTVSTANYSWSLAQNENAALPFITDRISVIWGTAGAGELKVTEYE